MKTSIKLFILTSIIIFISCEKDDSDSFEPSFFVSEEITQTDAAGIGYAISVEASDDVSWNASLPSNLTPSGWIVLTTASGKGNVTTISGKGNGQVYFNLQANEDHDERTAIITFTATSDRSSTTIPSQECVVRQIGADPAIVINPDATTTVPFNGNSDFTIAVTSNVTWMASVDITSGDPEWLSITAPEHPVKGIGEVKLNILENASVEERAAVVTVISTSDENLKKTLIVKQTGVVPIIEIEPVGTTTVSSDANPDFIINVNSNVTWTASVEISSGVSEWLSVIAPESSVTGDGEVKLNILQNTSDEERVAIVTVVSTTDESLKKVITITQSGIDLIVELTTFSPVSGGIRTEVTLEGKNFGSDPENTKVYFNNEAATIKSLNDNLIVVTVPRIAANIDCDVTVVMGNDSFVYEQKFQYKMSWQVSTVAGNGSNTPRFQAGPLTGNCHAWMIDVDADGNIFAGIDGGGCEVARINEKEKSMTQVSSTYVNGSWNDRIYGMSIDRASGIIYAGNALTATKYFVMDPAENWVMHAKDFTIENNPLSTLANVEKFPCFNPHDKKLYIRYATGHIVQVDPETNTGTVLFVTAEQGVTRTPAIDPAGEWCYMTVGDKDLYRFKVSNASTWELVNNTAFTTVWGVCFHPSNGLLYICDAGANCIKSYNPTTGIVETVAGSSSGYVDGTPEEAKFNNPQCMSFGPNEELYIADRNNFFIRKLAFE